MGLDYLVDRVNAEDTIKILQIFINHDYDLNKRSADQHSLLYNFIVDSINPNPSIIKFLIDNGAKMNTLCETKDDFLKLTRKIKKRDFVKCKQIILDNIDII